MFWRDASRLWRSTRTGAAAFGLCCVCTLFFYLMVWPWLNLLGFSFLIWCISEQIYKLQWLNEYVFSKASVEPRRESQVYKNKACLVFCPFWWRHLRGWHHFSHLGHVGELTRNTSFNERWPSSHREDHLSILCRVTGAGAHSSWHWKRGRVQRGHAATASSSQTSMHAHNHSSG